MGEREVEGSYNLKAENGNGLDELSTQGGGLRWRATMRTGCLLEAIFEIKRAGRAVRCTSGLIVRKCNLTSTRDNGLPLTLMIPFPFLQWLTATCHVVSGNAQQQHVARSNSCEQTHSVLLLAKALHRLAHYDADEW
jgi:hypothetical protein